MGKAKRKSKHKNKSWKNVPFLDQLEEGETKRRRSVVILDIDSDTEVPAAPTVVDAKLSKKILEDARRQQEDVEEELDETSDEVVKPTTLLRSADGAAASSSESEDDHVEDDNASYYEFVPVDEADERALETFMNPSDATRRTLADVIMERITEKKTELSTQFTDAQSSRLGNLDRRVVKVYKGVRDIMRIYRSGALPKAFKIIPSLRNWEEVLYITNPEGWTAAAVYQATRIFSARLKENMAQRFYNLVLLPRIRDDIAEYKKLNVYLYQALGKAMFKPGAFFKGILLPLCECGTCTLREAVIIGGFILKTSIPLLHSAAALLKIAEMEYNAANSVFMRVLLDKKYALPYRVVDAVVYHFLKFQMDKRELPVLWHQALLTLAQRYKEDLSSEQKEALYAVMRVHFHPKMTPEVRRELQNSKCRGDEDFVPEPMIVV